MHVSENVACSFVRSLRIYLVVFTTTKKLFSVFELKNISINAMYGPVSAVLKQWKTWLDYNNVDSLNWPDSCFDTWARSHIYIHMRIYALYVYNGKQNKAHALHSCMHTYINITYSVISVSRMPTKRTYCFRDNYRIFWNSHFVYSHSLFALLFMDAAHWNKWTANKKKNKSKTPNRIKCQSGNRI